MKPLQIIIVIALGVVGLLYWYSGQQEQHYDASAQRYMQQALGDISSWQREKIKMHLAPAARANIEDQQIDALIERYRGLGTFKQIDDVQFARLTAALSFFNSNILLSYHGQALFEYGNVSLTLTLVVSNGNFQIYNFSFGAPQIHTPPTVVAPAKLAPVK